MAAVHRFSAYDRALREDWFALVESPDRWTDSGAIGEGESQSIRVRRLADEMFGVAKPGPGRAADKGHFRAAHEKLAFDLSCLVALPVPAVVLYRDGLGAPYLCGRSISCWAFPQAEKWNEADKKGLLTPAGKASTAELISAMRVFHSWIGDADRKADHIVVDLDSPPNHLRIAFIDHGNSMSHGWRAADVPPVLQADYMPGVPEVRDLMRETAAYIAAIPDAEIERLVTRIPVAYLPDPQRTLILQNLLTRKAKLLALL
jgi:hypothetical protein